MIDLPHDLLMDSPDMAVQIRPTQAGYITITVRAVIPEEKHRILKNICVFETNA